MNSDGAGDADPRELLEASRSAEKEQALAYRALAAEAEALGETELAQRFHDLHADEQHHLSRLTARLLELGSRPLSVSPIVTPIVFAAWEVGVRAREEAEIERYQHMLSLALDAATRKLIEEILVVEEHHVEDLGGKWTMA